MEGVIFQRWSVLVLAMEVAFLAMTITGSPACIWQRSNSDGREARRLRAGSKEEELLRKMQGAEKGIKVWSKPARAVYNIFAVERVTR